MSQPPNRVRSIIGIGRTLFFPAVNPRSLPFILMRFNALQPPQSDTDTAGIKAKAPEKTKTVYPTFPDPHGQAAEIAARILERTPQFEALKGALEVDKAELKQLVSPHYFSVNHGRQEIPSSVAVYTKAVPATETSDGKPVAEVLVTFQNKYPAMLMDASKNPISDAELAAVFGTHLDECVSQAFSITIKSENLPATTTQDLINELQTLFAKYNATDALELKDGVKPLSDFHEKRHKLFTPAQNLAIEQICPIGAMVKTKGRKQ
jgi:hypothetical protein